tara:strand:+ start:1523 stop:2422 length:900 start_codon:yes stop_codon:yes gene_type:complete
MIHSMTGYGKQELNLNNSNFMIELKSLNSKQVDINIKMSSRYRDKEIELRRLISEKLQRGKIELSIWREKTEFSNSFKLNKKLIKDYYLQIDDLKKDLDNLGCSEKNDGSSYSNIIQTLVQMPDVFVKEEENIDENNWSQISKAILKTIDNLQKYRKDEGKKLEIDIKNRVNNLYKLLKKIDPLSKRRIEKIKSNLNDNLNKLNLKNIDEARFEQELIYYLEKQDITEEQVRLNAHLSYFLDCMKTKLPVGKKLSFIAQEIGREINTIGSKSSDSEMQKIVVQMKDELEKIKEQLLNIL